MFESLKSKLKNIFKKGPAEEPVKDEPPADAPPKPPIKKEEPVKEKPAEKKQAKEKPAKDKSSKKVFDDDWDDDWDEEPNDLIPEDEWVDEDLPEDDEEPPKAPPKKEERPPAVAPKHEKPPVKREEPAPKEAPKAAPKEIPKAEAPKPAPKAEPKEDIKPAEDDSKLSRKERARLAKQEKIAAKKAAKEKKHEEKRLAHEAKEHEQEEKKREQEEKRREEREKPGEEELVGEKGKKIKEKGLDEVLWELEIALMEADVALPVVEKIKDGVREDLLGKRHLRGYSLDEVVELSLKNAINEILKINEFDFDAWLDTRERPTVVMFVGINGTGKTTAIAKVAYRLMKNGKTVILAAGDTFRAGAIEQLTIHSERLECRIVKHSAGADPAAVAYDAIEHAKAKRRDVVLVDTAGRMQTNSNLMDEMKKIKRVAKPDLVMFVGDSLAGNDAVEQARAFDAAIGVDAIMLTKIDADSKGGAALSIAYTIGKPIAFVSNGQEYDQLVKFNTEWMMARLFED